MTNINLAVVIPDRDLTVERLPVSSVVTTFINADDTYIARNGDTYIARNGDTYIAHNTSTGYPPIFTAVLVDRELVIERD